MFKENFIKLCAQKGESPSSVVKKIGISPAAFSQWDEKTIPRKVTQQKIADYFGVTVDYLLNGEKETPSDASTEERECNKNIVRVIGRDGTYTERTLTDEQLRALQMIIDQMPDAPDDL